MTSPDPRRFSISSPAPDTHTHCAADSDMSGTLSPWGVWAVALPSAPVSTQLPPSPHSGPLSKGLMHIPPDITWNRLELMVRKISRNAIPFLWCPVERHLEKRPRRTPHRGRAAELLLTGNRCVAWNKHFRFRFQLAQHLDFSEAPGPVRSKVQAQSLPLWTREGILETVLFFTLLEVGCFLLLF